MMIGKWIDLARDQGGKGVIKMALITCLVAVAVATTSPGFELNPLIDKAMTKFRDQLPETGGRIMRAMGG